MIVQEKRGIMVRILQMALIICIASPLTAQDQKNEITLSFDAPFATTSYKQMLDLSMHIAGDLLFLQQTPVTMHERELFYDAIAGRITRLSGATDNLIKECRLGMPLLINDLEYLLNVLDDTLKVYTRVMPHAMYQVAEQLLYKVQEVVEGLLKTHFC